MNLYKILVGHIAPKDMHTAIACLVLAENDEQVYEFIKSQPETKEHTLFNNWKESEETTKEEWLEGNDWCSEEDADERTNYGVKFKDNIISIKGELNSEDVDWSDAYYGITIYGWELLKENVTTDYSELIDLKIIYKCGGESV
jgi:hypothetical protein